MTFLVCDGVRVDAGRVMIGDYRLHVRRSADGVRCELQCPWCPAVLSAGTVAVTGPLLAGVQALPAQPGLAAVSWAWGAAPEARHATDVRVVFARGLRRPAVAAGHVLTAGLWVGAAPGRARRAIAVSGAWSGEQPAQVLPGQGCPGRPADLAASGRRRHSGWLGQRP